MRSSVLSRRRLLSKKAPRFQQASPLSSCSWTKSFYTLRHSHVICGTPNQLVRMFNLLGFLVREISTQAIEPRVLIDAPLSTVLGYNSMHLYFLFGFSHYIICSVECVWSTSESSVHTNVAELTT